MQPANVAVSLLKTKSLMTRDDCPHEHNLSLGMYILDKPEDKVMLRALLDKNKKEWSATVEILLCSDCNRNHARMTMDL